MIRLVMPMASFRMLFHQCIEFMIPTSNSTLPPYLCSNQPISSFPFKSVSIIGDALRLSWVYLQIQLERLLNAQTLAIGNQLHDSLALVSANLYLYGPGCATSSCCCASTCSVPGSWFVNNGHTLSRGSWPGLQILRRLTYLKRSSSLWSNNWVVSSLNCGDVSRKSMT